MKKIFKVIRYDKGFGNMKPAYIVSYNCKEVRVPLFQFQKDRPCPDSLLCNVTDNGKITQHPQVLSDTFYSDLDRTYLFKVKYCWDTTRYYELTDLRFTEPNYTLSLPFSEAGAGRLVLGQLVKCRILEIKDARPYLTLVDANPSLIAFKKREDLFGPSDTPLGSWLVQLGSEDFMKETNRYYREEDGRWICHFAKQMERIICTLLMTDRADKATLLQQLCCGWTDAIEHSSFIGDLSGKERDEYSRYLTDSIEQCEDYLDALSQPDPRSKVENVLKSLSPHYFQYRIERRFRYLSCLLSLDRQLLQESIQPFLDRLHEMGEAHCTRKEIYITLTHILKLYVHSTTAHLINVLSISGHKTADIKRSVLALCYMTRIMEAHGDREVSSYVSKIYLLISLYMSGTHEKEALLKNAYQVLFSHSNPICRFKWNELEDIVRYQSYLFSQPVTVNRQTELAYEAGGTTLCLGWNHLSLLPTGYNGTLQTLTLMGGLTTGFGYNHKLGGLEDEKDFLTVMNVWKEVSNSVFTPIPSAPVKKKSRLLDGMDVDIYITETLNETTARCKAVGHDEEGLLTFKNLLFYDKPDFELPDLNGADGTPLVFPAVVNVKDDTIHFNPSDWKRDYVLDTLDYETVTAFVISKRNASDYICVTEKGFICNVNTFGASLMLFTFIRATITDKSNNGFVKAEYDSDTHETFDTVTIYRNYLRQINRWVYGEEMTLSKMESDQDDEHPAVSAAHQLTVPQIDAVTRVLSRYARLDSNLRNRYAYLAVCRMLTQLTGDAGMEDYFSMRQKYTRLLYGFSLNSRLSTKDVEEFTREYCNLLDTSETDERSKVLMILSKLGGYSGRNEPDSALMQLLVSDTTPIEKELTRLVLAGNMLAGFSNQVLQDKILDELGEVLNIDILRAKTFHIGEESQTQEFKTSLVYPPANRGNEDIEQQSDNIMRVILSMVGAKGGKLFIGVNDSGDVIGLHNDLAYFATDEREARDKFMNYFSCLLTERLGADHAAKFHYEFRQYDDYTIFVVDIPVIQGIHSGYIRVGNTVQNR